MRPMKKEHLHEIVLKFEKQKKLFVIEALKRCGLWRKYLTTGKQGLSQGEMQEIMTGWDPIVLILRGS